MLNTPYLLFLGNVADPLAAKVAQGIKDWRPEFALGQLRLDGCKADLGIPDMTVEAAARAGAKTLIVGAANRGGTMADEWMPVFMDAIKAGMDIASGLHDLLKNRPELVAAVERYGRRLLDVRLPTQRFPIADGASAARQALPRRRHRLLGRQDVHGAGAWKRKCCARGMKADFRATGQTGILITGDGVPLDAVVADFMAGAVEWLTPDNDAGPLGPDRGPGQPVPPVLFRRDPGAASMAASPTR